LIFVKIQVVVTEDYLIFTFYILDKKYID